MGEPQHENLLPEPSAELVLIRVLLEAHLDGMSSKDRARFVRRVNDGFAERLGLVTVNPIRPPAQFSILRQAQRQADAWWRKAMSARLMRAG